MTAAVRFVQKQPLLFLFFSFFNNNLSTFSLWRGSRCEPAGSRSDNRDNLAAVTNRLYFGSPWASIGLLVNGPPMINVKICLRKWGAVIRTGQSHSGSSPPRVSQPWNPSWNALHLEGKKRQFLIVFKKTECALGASGMKTCRRADRPIAKLNPLTGALFQPRHHSGWASFR